MHKIKTDPSGKLIIAGEVTFDTTPSLYKEGCHLINAHNDLVFDLEQVIASDNSGAALLTSWTRYAKEENKTINFINLPSQLLKILELTNLHRLLPIKLNEH